MARITQFLKKSREGTSSSYSTPFAALGMILSVIAFFSPLTEWYEGDVAGIQTLEGSLIFILSVFAAGSFAGMAFRMAPGSRRLLGLFAMMETFSMTLCMLLPSFQKASQESLKIGSGSPAWEFGAYVAMAGCLLSFLCAVVSFVGTAESSGFIESSNARKRGPGALVSVR